MMMGAVVPIIQAARFIEEDARLCFFRYCI